MTSSAAIPQPVSAGPERSKPGVINPSPVIRSREFVLTGTMRPGEPVAAVFRRLAADLRERQAEILSLMIYGAVAQPAEIGRAMHEELGETNWPVTWVEGASCDGAMLAGVQAFAISGSPVTRIRMGRRIVGSVFEDEGARHCLLGGLGPVATALHPPAQVQQMFANLELALEFAGFTLADVVRTWFYNEDILSWYGEFNRVRSAHYAGVRWRTGSLPASTGIGAHNPGGAAVQVALWAVQPLGTASCAREVGSPLQCPAPAYGSSFSRAMEITSGGFRRLLISGTAGIHPDGRTAWIGDARKQVNLTMEVVAAILQSRGLGYGDVTRATAYYRHAADRRHFAAWLAGHDLRSMPVVDTHSAICRDDLLFEIELDAVSPSRSMD
jgi:enamine deaminase RidA (YjgF/YER057c/UK114 family)